ncbi:MAG: T9SS C-terminal target domain-containing protein [Ignavibacteriae bacterium]|nr:MAG: T9SS C-terminal target domain-containing protein [Ignavibacteriota bacterium]
MKIFKAITIIILWIVSLQISFAQLYNPYGYTCTQVENPPELMQPLTGGQHKPERVDYSGIPSEAVFPVLVVFVQFKNDPGPYVDYWPSSNAGPTFMNQIIATSKNNNYGSNWWDAYDENNATLSDYWMEVSRKHMHIVGQAVSVVLDEEYTYYISNPEYDGIKKVNDAIYAKLQSYGSAINWRNYDKWSGSYGSFTYGDGDGYVDMIYKVFRSHNPHLGMPAGGIACLYESYSQGANYLIYNQGGQQIKINAGFSSIGSGITISPGFGGSETGDDYQRYNPMTKLGTISFSEHEHGHYLFGDIHMKYGKMSGASADNGLDEFLSPYESLLMGYITSEVADFSSPSHTLDDYSSRNSTPPQGEVIEVPINGSNEFFLISNRMKESKYDVVMWGDTAHDNPYRVFSAGESPIYGKGLYIYHARPNSLGYPYGAAIDQECADGLFNWSYVGIQYPDWNNGQEVAYYKRTSVSYYNDNGGDFSTLSNHDGKSIINWFGIGKRHVNLNEDGTDRIHTNLEEVWTSREWKGDRWDPWKLGYNEIFSPYSSPSTKNWNGNQTDIFIYLESQNGNTANLKIYKAGEGEYTEEDILALTPPSRPMMYPYFSVVECNGQLARPQIIWANNNEPDMIRYDQQGRTYKLYNIWRAATSLPNYLPVDYILIDTYKDYTYQNGDTASYIDHYAEINCNYLLPGSTFLRYQVEAVDKDNMISVRSDFINVYSISTTGNNFILPQKYENSISNYPNPFNPSTEIKFSIANASNVTLKVYNLIGEEVAVLINNEYKDKGSHSISFDGSNLASGVYFYKLDAGFYTNTKRMVLIK